MAIFIQCESNNGNSNNNYRWYMYIYIGNNNNNNHNNNNCNDSWLVVWNIFFVSIYWEESSQLTFIFFRCSSPLPPLASCEAVCTAGTPDRPLQLPSPLGWGFYDGNSWDFMGIHRVWWDLMGFDGIKNHPIYWGVSSTRILEHRWLGYPERDATKNHQPHSEIRKYHLVI